MGFFYSVVRCSNEPMLPITRAKNTALICCHFARNLAYYNATKKVLPLDYEGFWLTVAGNFIDVCALEWSKLFGNRNGKCHWQKVLKQPELFKEDFLKLHHLDDVKWNGLWNQIKDYRDNFVAHIEDQETTLIPCMTVPYFLVKFYYERLRTEFPELLSLSELPTYMDQYYDSSLSEAEVLLRTQGKSHDAEPRKQNA